MAHGKGGCGKKVMPALPLSATGELQVRLVDQRGGLERTVAASLPPDPACGALEVRVQQLRKQFSAVADLLGIRHPCLPFLAYPSPSGIVAPSASTPPCYGRD